MHVCGLYVYTGAYVCVYVHVYFILCVCSSINLKEKIMRFLEVFSGTKSSSEVT